MAKKAILAAGLVAALSSSALAGEGSVPTGTPTLQHVFLIMMENHGYGQIIGNPNAPFTNQLANQANLATNFFAVAHPSLTNYLEVVGGSNFGIHSDQNTDWHNHSCTPNCVVKDRLVVRSARDIEAGEQVTVDYLAAGITLIREGIACRCRPGCQTVI